MKRIAALILSSGFSLLAINACNGQTKEPDPDSETNWLIECTSDGSCKGDAKCLCGVCTISCSSDSACPNAPEGSVCVEAASVSSCTGDAQAKLCVVQCDAERSCASGQSCRNGICVAPAGSSGDSIPNPTGDCRTADSGARPGYHSVEPGTIWLPDCQNPLKREYWRVFARSADSAYVIPRPDGAPFLAGPCADPKHALYPVLTTYSLCQSASSSEAVERINNMKPADALSVTHYLHTLLNFQATGTAISPFAPPGDILDACALHLEQNSEAFTAICQRERQRLDSGTDIGFTYEGPGAVELALRLNELYGIVPTGPTGVCTPGADQTCNDDPQISSLHGHCNNDGSCTCLGFEKNPATGRCR